MSSELIERIPDMGDEDLLDELIRCCQKPITGDWGLRTRELAVQALRRELLARLTGLKWQE